MDRLINAVDEQMESVPWKKFRAISGLILNRYFKDKNWKIKAGSLLKKISNGWKNILGTGIPKGFDPTGGGSTSNMEEQTGGVNVEDLGLYDNLSPLSS